jgi:hypothetical protein
MLALASAQRCLLYLVIPDADGTPCLRPLSIPRE